MPNSIKTFLIAIAPIVLLGAGSQAYALAATDVDCDKCIDKTEIAPAAITAGKLSDKAVTKSKIQPGAVTTGKIKNLAITKSKIEPGAVTTGKIRSGAVTEDKLAPEVINLITNMSDEVAAMAGRIDALEAANVGLNAGDLDGNIYCVNGFGNELTGGEAPGIYSSHYRGVLTFTSSTEASYLDVSDVDAFLNVDTGNIGADSVAPGTITMLSYSVTGNTLSLFGPESAEFFISPDGNLLVGAESSLADGGTTHEYDLMIAVRADGC